MNEKPFGGGGLKRQTAVLTPLFSWWFESRGENSGEQVIEGASLLHLHVLLSTSRINFGAEGSLVWW